MYVCVVWCGVCARYKKSKSHTQNREKEMTEEQPKIEEVAEDGPPPLEEFKAAMPDLGAAAAPGFAPFEDGERGQSKVLLFFCFFFAFFFFLIFFLFLFSFFSFSRARRRPARPWRNWV